LAVPDRSTLKGKRDYVILAIVIEQRELHECCKDGKLAGDEEADVRGGRNVPAEGVVELVDSEACRMRSKLLSDCLGKLRGLAEDALESE
jgi:hypothetical protein